MRITIGVPHMFFEQGMETVIPTVQAREHIKLNAFGKPEWSYAGLVDITPGDYLYIIDFPGHETTISDKYPLIKWQGYVSERVHVLEEVVTLYHGAVLISIEEGDEFDPETFDWMTAVGLVKTEIDNGGFQLTLNE